MNGMGTECKRRMVVLGVSEGDGGLGCIKADGRFVSKNQPHSLHGVDPFHSWN